MDKPPLIRFQQKNKIKTKVKAGMVFRRTDMPDGRKVCTSIKPEFQRREFILSPNISDINT